VIRHEVGKVGRDVGKRMALTLLVVLLSFSQAIKADQRQALAKRAIIITVDGLGSWVLKEADAPNLRWLMNNGCYSLKAETVDPPATLPAHVSLFTAVPPSVHGFDFDTYIPERGYVQRRTLFAYAKAVGMKTAMVVGKKKLMHLANPKWVDYAPQIKEANATKVTSVALDYLKRAQPQLLFIHMPDPDWLGHKYGWGSKAQLASVTECDKNIGTIIKALSEMKMWEDLLLVVTADHGGEGRWHYGNSEKVKLIPFIASGGAMKLRGELNCPISICDIAPIVALALSLPVPKEWEERAIKVMPALRDVRASNLPRKPLKASLQMPKRATAHFTVSSK
jgi:predicted AlkP superfamily pyrophosphatase or phosphodiesterase